MNTAEPQVNVEDTQTVNHPREVRIYQHSAIFYWWPVWLTGAILAALTYAAPVRETIGSNSVVFHANKGLGVVFTTIFSLVFLLTSVSLRGLASALVIAGVLVFSLLFAWLGVWDTILSSINNIEIYMNGGFYVFFSSVLFIIWSVSFFVFDRLEYWIFRPGQMIHYSVWGGGERTFDSRSMTVYKQRDDLFRHWILGFGSGDLNVATSGAEPEKYQVRNTLFIGSRLDKIQHLIAMKPDDLSDMPDVAAGEEK